MPACPHCNKNYSTHTLLNINVTLALLLGAQMVIAKVQVESHNVVEAPTQFANPVVNALLTKLSEIIISYLLCRTTF